MDYRDLGRTGLRVSVAAFGGVSALDGDPADSDRLIHEAVDRGVTYFDVAPSYGKGEAEARLGRVLPPVRDRIILACKTNQRTADGARAELEQSLRRLRTDRFDVYQLHALDKETDLDTALGPGGAVEAFVAARDAGLVQFLGITGHNHALLAAAVDRFPFDTVLTPVNYALRETALPLLAHLAARGIGALAIKPTAQRGWQPAERASDERQRFAHCWYRPIHEPGGVAQMTAWVLAQPVAALVPGGSALIVRRVLDAIERGLPAPSPQALDALELAPLSF